MRDQTDVWQAVAQPKVAVRKAVAKEAEEARKKSSGWADPEEFRKSLSRIDMDAECGRNAGGVPLASDGKTVYADSSDRHTLIIGSTGSMKTRLLCMPTLEILARSGESVVVADPKGELYQRSSESFRSRGYNVQVVNLRDPMRGSRWNPLTVPYRLYNGGPEDEEVGRDMIMDLCMNLMPTVNEKDPYWDACSRELLFSLMILTMCKFTSEDEATLANLSEEKDCWFKNEKNMEYFKSHYDNRKFHGIVSVMNNAENTRRCILSNFDMFLWSYLSKSSLMDMMSGNDIDFSKVGRKKTAIFLLVPDEKDSYNGLVSLFVKQLYECLIREAHACKNGSLPVRVNFLLDEFASFPRISCMQSMITASRSRNIRFMLVVQSVKQLRSVYGADADSIKDNCLNWIFLSGRDIDFLRELCALMGDDAEGRPLATVSQLQRLDKDKGEALVLCGRLAPYITNLADIDKYPKTKMAKQPPSRRTEKKEPEVNEPKKEVTLEDIFS